MATPAVLIVEDDDVVRKLLMLAFEREPLHVRAAGDGVEALQEIAATQFAVILLDLMMPRMSGFELLQHLSELRPRPLVFVISAYDEPTLRKIDPELVHAFMRKPFDLAQVVDVVRECALAWEGYSVELRVGVREDVPMLLMPVAEVAEVVPVAAAEVDVPPAPPETVRPATPC